MGSCRITPDLETLPHECNAGPFVLRYHLSCASVVAPKLKGIQLKAPGRPYFLSYHDFIVTNRPEVNLSVGENDDRAQSEFHDDLATPSGRPSRPIFQFLVVRRPFPGVGTVGVDMDVDGFALVAVEANDKL